PPAALIGPHPQWTDRKTIVSLDPWGHLVRAAFAEQIRAGVDVRPTIAVTTAHIDVPEIRQRIADGGIKPDSKVVLPSGEVRVTKPASDPARHLPGPAERCGIPQHQSLRTLCRYTGRIFP